MPGGASGSRPHAGTGRRPPHAGTGRHLPGTGRHRRGCDGTDRGCGGPPGPGCGSAGCARGARRWQPGSAGGGPQQP
eukprot:8720619-Alexandrium_andersonii.AAC.1